MAFRVTSRVFKDGEMIPAHYTADGEDVSPPLDWADAPVGTKSFALICEDPDAPGAVFTHWLVFNIPASINSFQEAFPSLKALPNGTKQGVNDFGQSYYKGPAPPDGIHRYYFKLYALSALLDLEPGVARAPLEKMMQRRLVAQAQLMGKYQRSS